MADDSSLPTLGDRYLVEREIGRGGMATVYLAQDLKHARHVAIKLLRPELSAAVAEERFTREIQIAAQLSHPHILPLHDSGNVDGRRFYVMPYVEGETLRERIRRERQLPIDEALRIARQIASALTHAHQRGIVHRDIKPENILLHEGEALVTDFGIAHLLDSETKDRLTGTGIGIGTPEYMSPEQAGGDEPIDARSDVYSLACLLYEMLAGEPPFTGTPRSIFAKKSTGHVLRLSTLRTTIPLSVERAVLTALSTTPADRFRSAAEFSTALGRSDPRQLLQRGGIAVASVAVLVILAIWAGVKTLSPRSSMPKAVALVPCKSSVQDSTRRFLGELITEDLIAQVKRSRLFDKVIAFASVARYAGTTESPEAIAAALGVPALFYCSYEHSSSREWLRMELHNVADGVLIWTSDVERDASSDNRALLPALMVAGFARFARETAAGTRMATLDTTAANRDAVNLYREGQHQLRQFREDAVRKSIRLFREASVRDSTFAAPYLGLARAYFVLGIAHGSMDEREAFPLMRDAAERALALDETSAEAQELLGSYETYGRWNYREAVRRFKRAIDLDPSLASAHDLLGFPLSFLGRHDEAIAASARALELNPVDPLTWADAGVQYYLARRYTEGIPFIEKGLGLAPDFHPAHWALGAAYAELADWPRALHHLGRADSLSGHQAGFRGQFGYALALSGDAAGARKVLQELKAASRAAGGSGKSATAIAQIHIGLSEPDSAFAWLQTAYDQRSSVLGFILLSPPGRRLRADPRYAALVRRLGAG